VILKIVPKVANDMYIFADFPASSKELTLKKIEQFQERQLEQNFWSGFMYIQSSDLVSVFIEESKNFSFISIFTRKPKKNKTIDIQKESIELIFEVC
jgi:hypothetical protein